MATKKNKKTGKKKVRVQSKQMIQMRMGDIISVLMSKDVKNMDQFDALVSRVEGKKSQAHHGNVKEIRAKVFSAIKYNAGCRRLLFKFLGEK